MTFSRQTASSPPPPPVHRIISPTAGPPSYYSEKHEQEDATIVTPHSMPDMDNHDEESKLHRKQRRRPPLTERNCCCRWLCCACCLPVWARCIVWFIIIGIIICIIVIGALLGTFKMPTVNLAGVTEFPGGNASQITYDGSVFKLNIGLIVNVNNPNVLPIHLSDMNATATIPTSDGTSAYLGDGYLAQQTVPTQSSYNFTFPFSIEYDPSSTSSQTMLNTLVENCGLTGQNATDITVSYTIHLAARVLFVTIHPTISNTATFACPLTNGGIPGLSGGLLNDVLGD